MEQTLVMARGHVNDYLDVYTPICEIIIWRAWEHLSGGALDNGFMCIYT